MNYTIEQIQFIEENQADITREELTNLFNIQFKTNKTKKAICAYCCRKKLKQNFYSPRQKTNLTSEQILFLKNNATNRSFKELTLMLNDKYNLMKTEKQITEACNRRGIKNFIDARFEKGRIAENLGHYIYFEGDIWEHSNQVYIVVSNEVGANLRERSMLLKRYVYENYYGVKLTEKDCIIQLDRDYKNCEIENLYRIPSQFMFMLNRNKWLEQVKPKQKEFTMTAIKWMELYYSLKKGD